MSGFVLFYLDCVVRGRFNIWLANLLFGDAKRFGVFLTLLDTTMHAILSKFNICRSLV